MDKLPGNPLSLPFQKGQVVVVVLHSPRERIWGALLGLEAAGLVVRGLEITPWEEVLTLVRTGLADHVALNTRFFPMHRVVSMYLDEPSSGVPSMETDFLQRTGMEPLEFLLGGGVR